MIELDGGKLYQWETGRQLFVGSEKATAIQFANQGDTVALEIKQNFTTENGDYNIKIPDKYLQNGKPLLVYLVNSSVNGDEHSSQILETKVFPVSAKPKPKNYIPIAAEEALGVVRRLTDAAKEAATEAEEARVKAEAEKLYAEDAADKAETAKAGAEAAKAGAESARDEADVSAGIASKEALLAEQHANSAWLDSMSASSSQASAESDAGAALRHKEAAETAATNAATSANAAKEFKEATESAATNAGTSATKAETFASDAATSAAAAEAAKEATEETVGAAITEATKEILNTVDTKLAAKASIDDSTIGKDAWSSKNIVDKLCPSFKKNGILVQCEPVAGYPLKIVSDNKQLRFFVCGKNLYNATKYPLSTKGYIQYTNGNTLKGDASAYLFTEDFIPASHLRFQNIAIRKAPAKTNGVSTGAGIAFYTESKAYISGTNKETVSVPENAAYMRFTINSNYANEAQIEIGSAVTDFDEYIGTTVEAYHETDIPAKNGLNTVYALDQNDKATTITVTGKANPVAIIEKLTNAILATGANI